jgi:peptidoglycan/LPS O-acetylase OafA/YrhL
VAIGLGLGAGYAVYVATGTFPTEAPSAPTAEPPPAAFPLTHLWFLYVLLWLYAATLLVRGLIARLDRSGSFRARVDRVLGGLIQNPFGPIALAAPTAVALYLFPNWVMWFGLPTPDMSLIPNAPAAVQFFATFGLGWLLHRQASLMETWARRWPLNLGAAVALTVACIMQAGGLTPVLTPAEPGVAKLAYAATYALAIWTWTFAVVGLALRFLSVPSPVRRYVADSSYWIYLIHLPLVVFLQAWVSQLGWPWPIKFALILGVGFGVMFGTYALLVRHTFMGSLLNGRRVPRHAP